MGDFMFKSFEDLLITIALISNSFGVDILNQFSEDRFLNSPGRYVKDSRAALELYRVLQSSYPDESLLEKQKTWTNYLLKQGLSNGSLYGDRLHKNITTGFFFPDVL
jgi:ent-kaurene synthase